MSSDPHHDRSAVESLERRVAADATDAAAHYELAALLLRRRDYWGSEENDEALLDRTIELLTRAIALDPDHGPAHGILGHAYDQRGGHDEAALEYFRKARGMAGPRYGKVTYHQAVDVYVPTILVDMEREAEALEEMEAVARRHKVDLRSAREEIEKAGFRADAAALLTNGFISARNFFRSWLWDEAERIQNALDRGRKRRLAREELAACLEHQRALAGGFDVSLVPERLRTLASAASRYGVGDDVCRPLLMKRMKKKAREALIAQADALAAAVDEWLNTFTPGQMSAEAAAFMYLLNGVDEIR